MRIGYLDCFSGIAGDMCVGAMLDAGLELSSLTGPVASLGLPGVTVAAARVRRCGIAGTHFRVVLERAEHTHRHLDDILEIVARAELPDPARHHASEVFRRIAEVEAAVHDVPVDHVHFHEVGAADTIVDVVCACLGLHLLGIERLYASAVQAGSGTVRCEHGTMPVPAPGALGNLLGIPIRSGAVPGERVTPTGAALLRVLVAEFEPDLSWTAEAVGYGAGTRDDPDLPNLLRLIVGSAAAPTSATRVWELSCNLDTATGEQIGYLLEGALARGALDAFATPITMKKGRPAYLLSALTDAASRDAIARFLLEESSSLGVRMHAAERQVLERWSEAVATSLGPVRCKAARLPSGRIARRPEADEVQRLAAEHGIGPSEVLARLAPQL